MSFTRSGGPNAVSTQELLTNIVLGADTINKGLAQFYPSMRADVALSRFITAVNLIRAVQEDPSTEADGSTKDDKTIALGDCEIYDEFSPREFNADWEFLWSVGTDLESEAAADLRAMVLNRYAASFANNLEKLFWQGDTASGSAWLARFDGWVKQIDADADVINATPQGVISEANIISALESLVAACPESVQEASNPVIVVPNGVKYFYREAARALDYKGTNIDGRIVDQFGGYQIISSHGVPANRMFMLNAGTGDESNLKAATWMLSDANNVEIDRPTRKSRKLFCRISGSFGVGYVNGDEIVEYSPA